MTSTPDTENAEETKAAVLSSDFACVVRSLSRDFGDKWGTDSIETLVEEYKRFFALMILAPFPVVPSPRIDKAWHAHILVTRRYMDDCSRLAGKYIHHLPATEMEDSNKQRSKMKDDFAQTLQLYKDLWGEDPNPWCWSPKSDYDFQLPCLCIEQGVGFTP